MRGGSQTASCPWLWRSISWNANNVAFVEASPLGYLWWALWETKLLTQCQWGRRDVWPWNPSYFSMWGWGRRRLNSCLSHCCPRCLRVGARGSRDQNRTIPKEWRIMMGREGRMWIPLPCPPKEPAFIVAGLSSRCSKGPTFVVARLLLLSQGTIFCCCWVASVVLRIWFLLLPEFWLQKYWHSLLGSCCCQCVIPKFCRYSLVVLRD